jgi:glyoxylate utilization-related uncharacterized protein
MMNFPHFYEERRGDLVAIEGNHHIPFEIKRVFYIFDVPHQAERAGHAHKTCEQILIAISGECEVEINGETWCLYLPSEGLYIPPGNQIILRKFTSRCVLLVLASEHYSDEDYENEIRPIHKAQSA